MLFPFFSAFAAEEKKDGIQITADAATLLYDTKQLIFTGHVIAIHQNITLHSDEAIVIYDPENKNNSGNIIVKGHVIVHMDGDTAKSDYGEYDMTKNVILLKHNVRLQQGTKIITGSELMYDLKSNTASLSSPGPSRVPGLQGTSRVPATGAAFPGLPA